MIKKIMSFLCMSFFFSMSLYAGQGLADLTTVEKTTNNDQLIVQAMENVYLETKNDFNKEIVLFTNSLSKNISQLGDYSDAAENEFDANCDKELTIAIQKINKISAHSLQSYYDERIKIGIASNLGVTDPIAQKLESDINSIEGDMISEMRASVAILQSRDLLPAIGQEIKIGVDTYQKIASQEYAAAQAEAMKVPKTSWWKDLKASGAEFLGDVQVNLEKECKVAFTKIMTDTINELGQAATNQVVSYAGSAIAATNDAVNQMTKGALDQATAYGTSLTKSAMQFGTDLLGKELTATFEKYTTDQMNNMFKKFPDYLKKESFKKLGVDPDEDVMVEGLKAVIRQQYPVKNSADFDTLKVRQSTDLCPSEVTFVHNRMPKIEKSLLKHFDVASPLKIAMCASGGGNRAMLVALGFYLGAQDIGLFDSLLYTMGVSGGTWTITSWGYLNAALGLSISDFKEQLIPQLSQSMMTVAGTSFPPMLSKEQQMIVATNSAKHFGYDETVSSIDLYGGFIGNYTLLPAGKNRLNVTWSSIADTVEKGDMPLPMGAAVSYKEGQAVSSATEYYWYEIGPFETGSDQVGSYVPTWAFGSKFAKGKPVDGYQGRAPEYPLSYYQGVYGSAFAASMNEVVDQKLMNPSYEMFGQKIELPVDIWIKTSMEEKNLDTRMYPATFHNYTAGLTKSPIAKSEKIRLYDGAMNINFPLPLAMRPARDVDVIVICDAAVDLASLKSAEIHCKRNGQKFPDMSKYTKEMLSSQPLTVLNDPSAEDFDKEMVTILYCPFIKNNGYSKTFDPEICMSKGVCATFNFKYTQEQAEQVVDLTRYNVNQIQGQIKDVLKALEKHRASK